MPASYQEKEPMKKNLEKMTKKLVLNRETLADLKHNNLHKVAGGQYPITDYNTCDTLPSGRSCAC
jgi:hypothetical protein